MKNKNNNEYANVNNFDHVKDNEICNNTNKLTKIIPIITEIKT